MVSSYRPHSGPPPQAEEGINARVATLLRLREGTTEGPATRHFRYSRILANSTRGLNGFVT